MLHSSLNNIIIANAELALQLLERSIYHEEKLVIPKPYLWIKRELPRLDNLAIPLAVRSMSDLEKRAVDTEGEEGGGKKVKGGTSNMFMFKVRAFEDVLKLRGKHVPVLQPRSFNYLPDYND